MCNGLPGGHPEMGAFRFRRLSAHPLVRATSADMLVFSFAKRAHAQKFREWFGGELIDPPTRPVTRRRTDMSLDDPPAERTLRQLRRLS